MIRISFAALLEAIVADPPFLIDAFVPDGLRDPGAFGEPTVATGKPLNPVVPVSRAFSRFAAGPALLALPRRVQALVS